MAKKKVEEKDGLKILLRGDVAAKIDKAAENRKTTPEVLLSTIIKEVLEAEKQYDEELNEVEKRLMERRRVAARRGLDPLDEVECVKVEKADDVEQILNRIKSALEMGMKPRIFMLVP